MKRPLLLDLFCGAGGCSVGYHRAGFDVVGVDHVKQPRYPFRFVQADALRFLELLLCGTWAGDDENAWLLSHFAAIHASPPCQAYSISRNNGAAKPAPMLIEAVRSLLIATGKAWAIENVVGAPLMFATELCGASFGLGVAGYDLPRHRLFECSHLVLAPPCQHRRGKTIGVYGNGTNRWHREKMGRNLTVAEMRLAMGIDWMTRDELSQAIPPAYTTFVGKQLMQRLEHTP